MTPWDKELADEEWMADMARIVDAETIAGSALLKLIEARRLLREANHALMCDLDTAEESETRDRIRAFLDGEG